ncbi:MAG TPA: hypothetical protein VGX72_14280 [Solirubrobacteraceae bacterium]|nr:hypothetical protein [Solirubrobacteraceae bacterium]
MFALLTRRLVLATRGIVCSMLPLAASSGLAIIGGATSASVLFLWWLLRAETRDEAQEAAAEDEPASGEPQAAQAAHPNGVTPG